MTQAADFDVLILKTRLDAMYRERVLMKELIALQRAKIEQLENALELAKEQKDDTLVPLEKGSRCLGCKRLIPEGQVYCTRTCVHRGQRGLNDRYRDALKRT